MDSSSIYDVLRGPRGIPSFPAAVEAGDGVSIAEVLRYTQNHAVEIASHIHGNEIWFGDAAIPDAGVHEADRESLTTFRVDSGDNTWGTALLVLGTSDTPVASGMTKYDAHKVLITTAERTSAVTYLRFTFGTSEAQGITDDNSTVVAVFPTATIRTAAINFMCRRATAGTKLWVAAKVAGDTGTVNFVVGLHEYLI